MAYDSIGTTYIQTRQADPRVTSAVLDALSLPSGARVVDVGAGTGNYSSTLAEHGLQVVALEPSRVMRRQGKADPQVRWVAGRAEAIPLASGSVDAAVCLLAVHHFTGRRDAFRELRRTVRAGPIVLLTFDPRLSQPFWLAEYFPTVWQESYRVFPPLDELAADLAEQTGWQVSSRPFLLPPDLVDMFAAAGWQRPALYLDPTVRAGMSAFALADQTAINQGVATLERDLQSGTWDHNHGSIRAYTAFDAGYRLVIATPQGM